MRYSFGDLAALLRTPLGRRRVVSGLYYWTWPLFRSMASAYRGSVVRETRLIAVVGSLGKTTTTRAVTSALGRDYDPRTALNARSRLAQSVLRIKPGDRRAVLEISVSARGQMAAYARLLRPDVAVVTSVASEHNRSFGTLEVTRAEKVEIVRALPRSGLAVLNGDDPNVRWMEAYTQAPVRTFGFEKGNDVRATDLALDWPRGAVFKLWANGETRIVRSRLFGGPGVRALLAAATVALAEGFGLDDLLPGLEALAPTPGRLEMVRLQNGAYLLRDDFKGTLESVDSALDVLAQLPAERRIVVLGDVSEPPGSQGPIYRRLGERVARIAERALIVGSTKTYERYAVGATDGGLPRKAVVRAGRDVSRAAELLESDLRPGDVVLIKGRDTQRLGRVALALQGRQVRCDLRFCDVRWMSCDRCPMLERGWDGLRRVT